MVGLGETRAELTEAFEALRAVDVDILTVGQYLRPSERHLPLERYYHPDEFAEMKAEAPGARVQARRVGAAGPLELPRPRPGPGRGAEGAPPPGDRRRRRQGGPRRELTAWARQIERMFYSASMMRAEYREEPCRSALNRVAGMPFNWSLNPYMGCAHRCTFCYVRGFEKRADRPWDDRYGTSIRVKTNIVEVLPRRARPPVVGAARAS
jgi:hypothetical protein